MDSHGHGQHLERSMKIKKHTLYDVSSLGLTWQNMSASSLIERKRLNGDDSHLSISSESLIEDKEANRMVNPNFSYTYACSSTM